MLFTAAASVPAQPPSRLRFGWEHNPEKLQDFSDKIMRPRKDLDRATVLQYGITGGARRVAFSSTLRLPSNAMAAFHDYLCIAQYIPATSMEVVSLNQGTSMEGYTFLRR